MSMILRDLRAINVVSSKVNIAAPLKVSRENIASYMFQATYFLTKTLISQLQEVIVLLWINWRKNMSTHKKTISPVEVLHLCKISQHSQDKPWKSTSMFILSS